MCGPQDGKSRLARCHSVAACYILWDRTKQLSWLYMVSDHHFVLGTERLLERFTKATRAGLISEVFYLVDRRNSFLQQ